MIQFLACSKLPIRLISTQLASWVELSHEQGFSCQSVIRTKQVPSDSQLTDCRFLWLIDDWLIFCAGEIPLLEVIGLSTRGDATPKPRNEYIDRPDTVVVGAPASPTSDVYEAPVVEEGPVYEETDLGGAANYEQLGQGNNQPFYQRLNAKNKRRSMYPTKSD